jgi:hypothetical protein
LSNNLNVFLFIGQSLFLWVLAEEGMESKDKEMKNVVMNSVDETS